MFFVGQRQDVKYLNSHPLRPVGPQSAAMAGNLAWPLAAEELATIDWLWLMYAGIYGIYEIKSTL